MAILDRENGYPMATQTFSPSAIPSSEVTFNKDGVGSTSPQWLIKCKELFCSDIDGDDGDDSAPIVYVKGGEIRHVSNDCSGEHSGDGRVIASDVTVCMKFGSWAILIRQHLNKSIVLEKVEVLRYAIFNDTRIVLQTTEYGLVLIKSFWQENDLIYFTFNFVELTDTWISYGHNGKKIGNTSTYVNLSSVTAGEGKK